jgi:hypothetical protein
MDIIKMTIKADAITVKTIMEQFIKDDVVKKKLRMICSSKRNDWEKWLQLELEYFMTTIEGINIEREIQAFPDNRKLKNKNNMFIDLAFRKKRTRQNAYIFLELKCKNNVQALINGFERDIKKINALKSCMLDQRSFWCVGFHKNCTDKSISKINEYVNDWEGFHSVIKLCECPEGYECDCVNNKLGFAIL